VTLTRTFKALADPTRREILELLRERDMTAGEIAGRFRITQPSVSHHLAILKQAELVVDERQGQNILYSLSTSVMEEVFRWTMDMKQRRARRAKR